MDGAFHGLGRIYAAHPSYGGGVPASHQAFWTQPLRDGSKYKGRLTLVSHGGSLLAHTFNTFWADALNLQSQGDPITHFCMLHDDIVPEKGWLEILYEELVKSGADMMAALVPIKDSYGLSSTAISAADPFIRERRITMTEAHMLPETFGIEETGYDDRFLLANTGCWICKFTDPWRLEEDENGVLKFCFTINDRIRRTENKGWCIRDKNDRYIDGPFLSFDNAEKRMKELGNYDDMQICSFNRYQAEVEPEDWYFSRRLGELGCKVMVTRKLQLTHMGAIPFSNSFPWGDWAFDHVRGHQDVLPTLQGREKCPELQQPINLEKK